MTSKQDQFSALIADTQQRVFGYILGLVRNSADAQDVLQQTAVTAWRKFDQFDPNTEFFPWAIAIARYETLSFLKYRRRSRLYFDQDLMLQLEQDACNVVGDDADARFKALTQCLTKLPASDLKLIECRYSLDMNSHQIGELLERSQPSICNSLKRIRETLMHCISRSLSSMGAL
jgi:RNA polymerase sigma-70 factor (ECF subfamily)